MHPDRRRHVDAMFRARVSWIVVGGVGLLGLLRDSPFAVRGALMFVALATFGWLNRLPLDWIRELRRDGDTRWQPMAVGLALRCAGLMVALAVGW